MLSLEREKCAYLWVCCGSISGLPHKFVCWLFSWSHQGSWVSLCFTCFYKTGIFLRLPNGSSQQKEVGCRGNPGFLPAKTTMSSAAMPVARAGWWVVSLFRG